MDHHGDPRAHDHASDPAHTPDDGWVEEGGASHLGPATHTESGHVEHDDTEESDESDDEEPSRVV